MNQQDFSNIEDLPLPEGTPVTGYKLVYHASDGNYYPYMNRDPFWLEDSIQQGEEHEAPYEKSGISTITLESRVQELTAPQHPGEEPFRLPLEAIYYLTQFPTPFGYYYWQDKGVAEAYARWAAPQPSQHSTVNRKSVVEEGKQDASKWWSLYPIKSQQRLVGRYELLRVEGTHVPKTENYMDRENEGHVMNNMKIFPEPIAVFDILGQPLSSIQSFEEYIAQQKAYLSPERKPLQSKSYYH